MGTEIERKFLVHPEKIPWPSVTDNKDVIEQSYLCSDPAVRVRVYHNKQIAKLTIKGKGTIERAEFEYEIPIEDAWDLCRMAKSSLRKIRYHLGRWEIDQFYQLKLNGSGQDLWLAEIELTSQDEPFDKPEFIGVEVTYDVRYSNAYLAEHGCPPIAV